MTKLIRPQPTYRIEDVPVYGTLEVSSSSQDRLTVPQAFEFARKHDGRLQTIGEALAVRVAFYNDDKETKSGIDGSADYQRTSTISLKLKNNGSFTVDAPYVCAFVDLEDNKHGRALLHEGYDANCKGNNLLKSVKDGFICDLIAQAKDTGRVASALAERPLKLATAQKGGKSAYGQHPNVIAVFGNTELTELNAHYLSERGYKEGFFLDYTTPELEDELKGKEDNVIVRSVGLGGDNYGNVGSVGAVVVFNYYGRARGVVHVGAQKISSGRKGSKAFK